MLCALAACGFRASDVPIDGAGDPSDGPGEPDAPPDSSIDGPPSAGCSGTFAQVCLVTIPMTSLDVNAPLTIDTDTSPLCVATANGTAIDACVLVGANVTINQRIEARGSRPLVLLATTGQVIVNGTGVIDVSSQGSGGRGAGALITCVGTTPAGSRAGGHGGSFVGRGGRGGDGQGAGGVAGAPAALPVPLRGGCPGGAGEGGSLGGLGGGAVALIAPVRVTINGLVHASGGGGRGGASNGQNGGGGGGSGGSIWLDAPNVVINSSGKVAAQGGGGGQGSNPPTAGTAGGDVVIPGIAATGGTNPSAGGTGGLGGRAGAGVDGGSTGTGGGGGGGAGWFRSADPTPDVFGLAVPPPS